MNKADPFGEMSSRKESITGDEPVVVESTPREEEPVEAGHVGAFLCATRMRAGGDLQEIAKILRIRYGYLVAIEDGRHEDLPGSAYSIGFIRAYADYLGLDGNEVVRRLREETNGTVTTARFKFPAPSGESGLPNGGLLAIAVVMGMVVYGSWYTITNSGRDAVDLIQEVPDRLAALVDDQDQGVSVEQVAAQSNISPLSPADDVAITTNETNTQTAASDPIVAASQNAGVIEALDEVETTDGLNVDATETVETTQIIISSTDTADLSPELALPEMASEDEQAEVSAQPQDAEDTLPQRTPQTTRSTELINPTPEGEASEVVDTSMEVEETSFAVEETSQFASEEQIETETVESTPAATPFVEPGIAPTEATVISTQSPEVVEVIETEAEAVASDDAKVEAERETSAQAALPETTSAGDTLEVAEVDSAESTEAAVIELRAKSDSWIQVRDGDELLLTRLLREGEVYRVPDRDGLTLMTGNAGGLEVFVGGKLVPPLGDKGVVRRGVPLNAERLKTGVAPG